MDMKQIEDIRVRTREAFKQLPEQWKLAEELDAVLFEAMRVDKFLLSSIVFPKHAEEVFVPGHGGGLIMSAIPRSARLEQMRGDALVRFVVELHAGHAGPLRAAHNLPIVPAPLDASDAIVRAAHELASATRELQQYLHHERTKGAKGLCETESETEPETHG